jgi:hypothetical protein
MNFIKRVFEGKIDDASHRQFVRFGKGEYGGRALLGLWKTKNIKIKSSFEFANDFVLFVANLGDVSFSGDIWSKDELDGLKGQKKAGKWVYKVNDFTSSQVKNFADKAYYFLLNAEQEGIKLKIKAKLPKPGKSESKVDDKFCQMEIDAKYYKYAKDDFFWDLPDGKKMNVAHKFLISEIIAPKTNEKDFAKIREMAKRKGKIIRTANVDGKEVKFEKDFEA